MTPVLHTDRLTLRPVTPDEAPALHAQWTDPVVRRYLFDDAVLSPEAVADLVGGLAASGAAGGPAVWTVWEGEAMAGMAGLVVFDYSESGVPQLIVALGPAFHGRGIADEACRAVLGDAFGRLGLASVLGEADAPNVSSIRLMERLGMERTADSATGLLRFVARP